MPTVSSPALTALGMQSALGRISVIGPGQNASISFFAAAGDGAHQRRNFLHAGNVGNQRVILWAALRFKNLNDGLGVQRVCAQP